MSKILPSYRIGDLVWCRWNGGVWWPAMISYDPHGAIYFKASSTSITQYHIQYFGIMARRGWVSIKLLVPIQSIDEKKLTKKLGKKVLKDYEAAMAEVEEAFGLDLKRRKLKFIFNFVGSARSITRKRKHESNSNVGTKIQKTFVSIENQNPSSYKSSLVTNVTEPIILQVPSPTPLGTSTEEDMFLIPLEKANNPEGPHSSDDCQSDSVESATSRKLKGPTGHLNHEGHHQPDNPPVVRKVEEPIGLLPSTQSTDYSQATDSGFETGSELSNTPIILTTPTPLSTITDQSNPVLFPGPLESVGNILGRGEELKNNLTSMKQPKIEPVHKPSQMTVLMPKSNCSISNILYAKCAVCDNSGTDLVTCTGQCYQKFHLDCLGIIDAPVTGFMCDECIVTPTTCYQCHKPDNYKGDTLVTCDHLNCTKHYHKSCVRLIKSFQIDDRKLICGLHSCAKCVGNETTLTSMKLIECVQCPLALHKSSCLMAGCEVINDKQMVCYKHLDLKSVSLPRSVDHFNMNTCLDCGDVGSLVCCDFCSAAYHNHCLSDEHKASDSTQEWLCPNCLAHDLPTYESVVLCKCGSHR